MTTASEQIDQRIRDLDERRAIDIREGEERDEPALKDLIHAAVALNLEGKSSR